MEKKKLTVIRLLFSIQIPKGFMWLMLKRKVTCEALAMGVKGR